MEGMAEGMAEGKAWLWRVAEGGTWIRKEVMTKGRISQDMSLLASVGIHYSRYGILPLLLYRPLLVNSSSFKLIRYPQALFSY
jgi:hypothetical protein